MKKYLLFWIIIIACVSCTNKKNQLEKILLDDEYWSTYATYFPLYLSLYGELERDTIHVMVSAKDLADDLNINIIPYEIFPQLLYNEIISNKGCINVDVNVFKWYRDFSPIETNAQIDSIYIKKGISGILDYAVDEYGRLIKHGKEGSYIMYLCFQNGILFYSPYNEPWIYVNLNTIRNR